MNQLLSVVFVFVPMLERSHNQRDAKAENEPRENCREN
jgi:hypothetical protein